MTNSPRCLHGVLFDVQNANAGSVQNAWTQVLESPVGSPEFAYRHAVVMDLLAGTVGMVKALPKDPERWLKYVPAWWTACVQQERTWSQQGVNSVIDDASLDMLASLADVVENMDGGDHEPASAVLASLREQADKWLAELGDATIPKSLKLALTEQLQTVIWLVDNANRFGAAPVVAAADRATGGLVRAGITAKKPGWSERFNRWAATITLTAGAVQGLHELGTEGQDLVKVLEPAATVLMHNLLN